MESESHLLQMWLLIGSLRLAWKARQDFYVGGNMFIYFSETQAKKNDFRGPDVFVVLDTTQRVRRSWVVWEEEGRTPDVVIELTSPSTENTDRGNKMRIYSKVLKVAEYYLFDPLTVELEGYRLDPRSKTYLPMKPDEQGRLPCDQLGLMLSVVDGAFAGVTGPWLRWLTPEGMLLPHADELAEQEAERASALERELEALKQQLRDATEK
jgi:Uma2 family endonuclease